MNWYKIFYLLSMADNLRGVAWFFLVIFVIVVIISLVVFFNPDDKAYRAPAIRWLWRSILISFILSMVLVLTPSKKDTLLIIAGGGTMEFLSSDSTAKQIPHEVLNYLKVELQDMAADARVSLGVKSQKEKILEEAENMTTNQLMERMKVDSTFRDIILDKN